MQAGSVVRTFSRFATRQVLLAIIAVAAAMVALALLAEAMNGGGGAVYLAQIDADQQPGGVPSLVAVGYGTATVPAETALLQLLVSNGVQFDGGYVPPAEPGATPGAREQEAANPIVEAIAESGVPRDSIHVVISSAFGVSPYGNPEAVTFRIDITLREPDLETLNATVNAAAQAARQDGYSLAAVGALYGVTDCGAVQSQAWEAAVANARASAEHQAEILNVKLGDLLASHEALAEPVPATGMAEISGACTNTDAAEAMNPYLEIELTTPRFEPNRDPVAFASARVSLAFEIIGDQ